MPRYFLIALIVAALALAGCQARQDMAEIPTDTVIMTVNGVAITQGQLNTELAYLKTYRTESDDALIEEILTRTLIRIAAMRALYGEEEVEKMRQECLTARERVMKGEAFADVAKACSDCSSAPEGGELGEYSRGMMVEPFGRYSFTTPQGQVSDVFLTVYGWHFIKINKAPHQSEEGKEVVDGSHILTMYFDGPIRKVIYLESLHAEIECSIPRYARVIPRARKWYQDKIDELFAQEREARNNPQGQ